MYKLMLFVGLPGSGKTHHANKFCDIVIDDITDLSQLPDAESIGSQDVGITDVNFCDSFILEKALSILKEKYPNHSFDIVYFENDSTKCRSNVKYRSDGRNVEGTIRRFEKIYNPPTNAKKIWEPH
jgi:hypothetical protein